jgi:beta-lactamase regulating signal transducer with metallopeptidase domain
MSALLMCALNWLSCATAGVTVTAMAMWVLLRLCPVRSPAIQRFAWLLVLLPGVVFWRMSVVLPIIPTTLGSADVRHNIDRIQPLEEAGTGGRSLVSPSAETTFSTAPGHPIGLWAAAISLGAWLAGLIVLAARWAWSYVVFMRYLPRPHANLDNWPAKTVTTEVWIAELRDVCKEFGLWRPIPLHVTAQIGPALCLDSVGYRLLVPRAAWSRLSVEQRRSILRHEMAHYVRGDLWKSLLARLLACPQWFNPLAWLAIRRFEEAAECACDDAVVTAAPENAFDYLRALLELGTNDSSTSALQAAAGGGSLERRVRRLLSPAGDDSAFRKLVAITFALVLVAGGFARIRFASAHLPESKIKSAQSERTDVPPTPPPIVSLIAARTSDPPSPPPVLSLIANAGFEEFEENSDDPKGWWATRLQKMAGHFYLATSQYPAHGGKRSVVVEIGDNHPDQRVDYNWTIVAKGWKAGETYELSGWVRTENARSPAVILATCRNQETKQGKMIGFATTERQYPITGTTDWTRVSTRLTVPEGTSVVRIRAGLSSQNNRGARAWFDDLALVAIDN